MISRLLVPFVTLIPVLLLVLLMLVLVLVLVLLLASSVVVPQRPHLITSLIL